MATEALQEKYTSKSEAHLAVSPNASAGLPVESIGDNTLPGLPIELIGQIASHLDSASLHNLRSSTKWLAAAVNYHYTERHPTYTVCRHAKQLPGFLNQLNMPAIYAHINRLELTDGVFATAYPAFPLTFFLPHLSELILVGIELDGMSLLNMCISHRATLRSLGIHNVYLEDVGYWEAILFLIMTLLKLDVLQDKGLLYKSEFTNLLARVYLPWEGRSYGLKGVKGLKGCEEIKQLMNFYFHDASRMVFRRKIDRVSRILRESKSVRRNDFLHARGLHTNTC